MVARGHNHFKHFFNLGGSIGRTKWRLSKTPKADQYPTLSDGHFTNLPIMSIIQGGLVAEQEYLLSRTML